MTISERIFEKLSALNMSQKVFSEKTGIQPSTISEWKKNKTNPSSDKILAICLALDVTPEWLLSGVEGAGGRVNRQDCFVIDKDSDLGCLIEIYNNMTKSRRDRLCGYADALNTQQGKR